MSEPGPESIPASSDRNRRPLKRQKVTPLSEQAKTVEALFAKPDQEIRIPTSSSALTTHAQRAIPEIVSNVQGSSAGAGSGEFHVYKASRRREYERLRAMDEEVKKEEDDEKYARERREREERDREATEKKRLKRMKKNMKSKGGKNMEGVQVTGGEASEAPSTGGVKTGMKARVDGASKNEALHDRGPEGAEVAEVKEEQGLIICDDY